MVDSRFYEEEGAAKRRSAPAALRNREPIAKVLCQWLPSSGLVLEVASGTGEHAVHFAATYQHLEWQPSDMHSEALASIRAWRADSALPNLRLPIELDAAQPPWPIEKADAVLNINMVHISSWTAALGLLDGSALLLGLGSPLILYGPWITDKFPTAPSNQAFDIDLKSRDPAWGLRKVEDFAAEAAQRRFELVEQRPMPANNLMLLFSRRA